MLEANTAFNLMTSQCSQAMPAKGKAACSLIPSLQTLPQAFHRLLVSLAASVNSDVTLHQAKTGKTITFSQHAHPHPPCSVVTEKC